MIVIVIMVMHAKSTQYSTNVALVPMAEAETCACRDVIECARACGVPPTSMHTRRWRRTAASRFTLSVLQLCDQRDLVRRNRA